MKRITCLSGHYGVGKTTAIEHLETNIFDFKRESLGNYVRNELVEKLDLPYNLLYNKPTPPFVRNLIKGYGEVMKATHSDKLKYWTNKLISNYKAYYSDRYLGIDDIRFDYEFEHLCYTFGRDNIDLIFIGLLPEETDYDLKFYYDNADYKVAARNKEQILNYVLRT